MIAESIRYVKGFILVQYRESVKVLGLISSFVSQVLEITNLSEQLRNIRSIDLATGAQLNIIGSYVGEPRALGDNDEAYREKIRIRIAINNSQSTEKEIISLFKQSFKSPRAELLTLRHKVFDFFFAKENITDENRKSIPLFIKSISAIYYEPEDIKRYDPVNRFSFNGGGGKGFGEGKLSETIFINGESVNGQ